MEGNSPQILVYFTTEKNRVLGGDPLTLCIHDKDERKTCITDMAWALRGTIVELKNGDTMIISNTLPDS